MEKKFKIILKNIWDVENTFYLESNLSRLIKTISHYEIFKKSIDVKGSIIECGVFKGISLVRFLTFREFLEKKSKKAFGFDVFGKFPKQTNKKDNSFAKRHDRKAGFGYTPSKLNKIFKNKKIKNYKLIKGEINKTIPIFLKKNKKLKISFLHVDLDVYEPTFFTLNAFYKYISPKGIILLDDYSSIDGATNAINDFIKKKSILCVKIKLYYILIK